MKKLQNLGRVLSRIEQSTINGGIRVCGTRCLGEYYGKDCCVKCTRDNNKLYCPIKILYWGINDVPTIV